MKRCMAMSFVHVILMNGSLKHDTKVADEGGLDLTFCMRVLGKVEGEGLQTRNRSFERGREEWRAINAK